MVEQKAQISSVNWLEQRAHVLDRAKSSSANDTKPIHLPLEVPGDLDAHPHPPLISQVHLVMVRLRLAPLLELVFLHTSDAAILLFLCAILDPQPVKPGGDLPLLLVEVDDPGVQLFHLLQEVGVVGGWGAIVREPDQFRCIEHSSHHKLILDQVVIPVLVVYCDPEVEYTGHNVRPGLPLDEVIQTSTQEDPHWPH